ncbi:hypothetical protein ACFC58_39375 [Kitasatospora purpeofusca]|uniref:hypothetical protein n=1 Tax=Kitasatospora purpeofusca TaxID=67352 RepID=UPI0035D57A4A
MPGTGVVGRSVPPALGVGDAVASVGRAVGLSDAVSRGAPAGGAEEGRAGAEDGRAAPAVPVADGVAAGSGTRSGAVRRPSECSEEERPLGSGPPDAAGAAGAGDPGTGGEDRGPSGFAGSGVPGVVAALPLFSATPARGPAVVAGAGGCGPAGPDVPEGLPTAGTGAPAGAPAGGEAPGRGVRPGVPSYWTAAAVPPARAATETTSVHHTAVRDGAPRPPVSHSSGAS